MLIFYSKLLTLKKNIIMQSTHGLQIGNWVEYQGYNCQVDSISQYYAGIDPLGIIICDDINPILLTPDILAKCGFVLNEKYDVMNGEASGYTNGGVLIYFSELFAEFWINVVSANDDGSRLQPGIHYLHELAKRLLLILKNKV